MPTRAATARAVSSRSPVSIATFSPRAFRRATAAAASGLTAVRHREQAQELSVGRDEEGSLALRGEAGDLLRDGGQIDLLRLHEARASDQDAARPHASRDAEPRARLEVVDLGQIDGRAPRRPRAIAAARGCADFFSSAAARPRSSSSPRSGDVDALGHAGLSLRERAGLVEENERDAAGLLEGLGVSEENARPRAAPGSDEDRGRRGEPQGAGAGDDQDRGEARSSRRPRGARGPRRTRSPT